MELALTNVTFRHHRQPLSVNHPRRNPNPNSITFIKSQSFTSLTPIKSSKHHQPPKSTNPRPLPFLKTTFITGVTVAAVFLSRLTVKPSFAAPPPPPAAVETVNSDTELQEEEKTLEQRLCTDPNDAKTLKNLMEIKIKIGKVQEAIGILNQLIDVEPEDGEWKLLKHHLNSYAGDHESAKLGFEEIIKEDPFRVEAYHGLVMAASASESVDELKSIETRIVDAIELCKKGKKKDEVRDFKLLLAQIRVIRGDYNDAIKIYEELSKEEPRDFRPYLCQGIIYTLLGKNDDAESNFGKYRRLVPKGHPYTKYFDDNMVATKAFAGKVASERAYAKS
ncbi:protein SLOW GREEN 1, chloroplastic-like [Bidens hawaiensis]|uniref:protein SLOW GREEN 1, chloroplastic-like n=1 Tax=Bidens hawaiensis TaxID=980011 RepID=UPI00404A4D7A